jgi:hypothetical protein
LARIQCSFIAVPHIQRCLIEMWLFAK